MVNIFGDTLTNNNMEESIYFQAKDLMLGDWIKIGKVPLRVIQLTHFAHKDDSVVLETGSEYLDVEPIPLTAEILEKNGFIRQQFGHFRYENEDEDLAMGFYPKEKNYTEGGYDYIDIYKGRMTLREMPISYVHELQHALRLCGIDKEIVL